MINNLRFDAEKVYAVGDIHGSYNVILPAIKSRGIRDAVIVFCGDIGLGFSRPEHHKGVLSRLSELLEPHNIKCVFFRGNHDDPKYYDGKHFVGDEYKNVFAVPDYTVITINGKRNILCIGGAISVDRWQRKVLNQLAKDNWERSKSDNKDRYCAKFYWDKEPIVYSKRKINALANEGLMIDTVCTHSCPQFAFPSSKGEMVESWIRKDPILADDLDEERYTLSVIYNDLLMREHPIKKWVYGHFHQHNEEEIDGIMFLLLNMQSMYDMDIVEI